MAKTLERIVFRLIHMPCCGQSICWVNPRLPIYCPECGTAVFVQLTGENILMTDDEAVLEINDGS